MNEDERTALDHAMFSVWLHGKWRWLTTQMTTEAREAAWAAVKRHRQRSGMDEPLSEDWAWWRS